MSNYFIDKEKIKQLDIFRIYYFLLFVLSFLLTEIGRYIYRPFIYKNQIDDWGLADSVGNWGGILVQIFFGLLILNPNRKKGIRIILFFTLGYVIYEIIQPLLPKGTFDWKDIYGTLIGGVLGLALFWLIHKFGKNKLLKTHPKQDV